MSITGDTGGRQFEDSGRSPSISGKQGTPAMSVASSTALREVPMAGDEGVDRCDGDVTSSGERTGTQAWTKSGRIHSSAYDPWVDVCEVGRLTPLWRTAPSVDDVVGTVPIRLSGV